MLLFIPTLHKTSLQDYHHPAYFRGGNRFRRKQSDIQGQYETDQDRNLGFELQIQGYFHQVIVAPSHQYTQVSAYF